MRAYEITAQCNQAFKLFQQLVPVMNRLQHIVIAIFYLC